MVIWDTIVLICFFFIPSVDSIWLLVIFSLFKTRILSKWISHHCTEQNLLQRLGYTLIIVVKGSLLYRICFKYFSHSRLIQKCISLFGSCFKRWWCIKTGQASNLEIILVNIGVRSVWLKDYLSIFKVY